MLSIILAFSGTCFAWYDGSINIGHAVLAGIGLILTHISCNTLNDYFDYKSGIDLVTDRTPFSGGSGILREGFLSAKEVFWLGMTCFILAVPIGIYFIVVKGLLLLPLLVVAALCILFYSPMILKRDWPEWSPGLGLGVLPILGMYFAQTGMYTWHAVVASIPAGILVHNLLLLNEFPDVEADQKAQRKTLPIRLGRHNAGIVYSFLTILTYLWIVGAVIAGIMPIFALIALLTIPLAIKAIQGSLKPYSLSRLVPAMANNVLVVLVTQLLLGIGYVLAIVFS